MYVQTELERTIRKLCFFNTKTFRNLQMSNLFLIGEDNTVLRLYKCQMILLLVQLITTNQVLNSLHFLISIGFPLYILENLIIVLESIEVFSKPRSYLLFFFSFKDYNININLQATLLYQLFLGKNPAKILTEIA